MRKYIDLPDGAELVAVTNDTGDRWRIVYDDGLTAACPFADEIEVDADRRLVRRRGFSFVRLTTRQMELFDILYLSGPTDRGELFARLYDYRPDDGDDETVDLLAARLQQLQSRARRALIAAGLTIESRQGIFSIEKI